MKQTDATLAINILRDFVNGDTIKNTDQIVSAQNVIAHLSTYFTAPAKSIATGGKKMPFNIKRPIGQALAELILATRQQNATIQPLFDHNYACETCCNDTGSVHPETGHCFVCGADDFIDIDMWRAGIVGEAYLNILHKLQ